MVCVCCTRCVILVSGMCNVSALMVRGVWNFTTRVLHSVYG